MNAVTPFEPQLPPDSQERLRSAATAFLELTPGEQDAFVDWAASRRGAGEPPVAFGALAAEAVGWARWAGAAERRAYLIATFGSFSQAERKAALDALRRLT